MTEITITLPEEKLNMLKEIAERRQMSLNALVVSIIEEYLDRLDAEGASKR